jgi:ATP-dependent DNA helicase RecG
LAVRASSPAVTRSAREGALAWEDPVDRIAGLGAAARAALGKAGVGAVADLAWLVPASWDDLRAPMSIADAVRAAGSGESERVCMCGVVTSAGLVPMRGRRAVRVVLADVPGAKPTLHAWWFFAAHGVLANATVGARVLLVGRVRADGAKPARVAHGDLISDVEEARIVRARYPRLGVAEAALRGAVASAIARTLEVPDPVPHAIATREAMTAIAAPLRAVHALDREAPSDADLRAVRERLAWAEAFARVRDRLAAHAGEGDARALPRDATTAARFLAELGFTPTAAQLRGIGEIASDLAQTTPMRRLLLGDVGSGKTAVALAAAAQCVAAGAQVAILAPTSVLAEQYIDSAAPLARATGASVALVSAGLPAAQRKRVADALARGDIAVAVGTHALLSRGTSFARLGLVIVDEQHRLGVAQRLALVQKGATPHLLTLSATPIPRTLALALRGELATSTLDERPRGRALVATELVPRHELSRVTAAMREACARGERVFFVAPRIEDDDDGAKARATELAAALAPAKVTLVHGALSVDAKRTAMRALRSGAAQVLVATTVIEVGVDVPEATLIVVDGAERFGLAQLHQLRGRVGRGTAPSRCLLVHGELGDLARRRLEAIARTHDGAAIARIDLELRGAGDLGGTRQSGGEEELRFLDPMSPPPWLERVEADVRAITARDPELASPEHRALRLAVARYERALAVREEAG